MHERVAELFEDRLVDLGLLARDREIDLLAKLLAHITHETRETIKREADRQHANSEHALLELARVTGQLDQTIAELIDLADREVLTDLAQHRLRDDELTHDVDKRIDLFDVYTD